MSSLIELKTELATLNWEWKKLHSNLIQAEANHDESRIINLLSKIQSVAKKQAEIKEKLDELR